MGWGADAKRKRLICGSTRQTIPVEGTAFPKIDGVVIDVNGTLRTHFGYNSTQKTETPRSVMLRFLSHILKTFPSARTYVFCFDSGHLVPLERKTFYKTRRYAPAVRAPKDNEVLIDGKLYKKTDLPLPSKDIERITADHMPESASGSTLWSRVWQNTEGKARLWYVLGLCLVDILQNRTPTIIELLNGTKEFIVDAANGERTFIPLQRDTNLWTQWGEADTKCFQWGAHLCALYPERTILFETIDWDAYIQVMTHAIPNMVVRIGRVYMYKDTEYYSRQSRLGTPKIMHETIECQRMYQFYGDREQRLHAMFWCLCCGGVDYCVGLTRYGYNQESIQEWLTSGAFNRYMFLEEGMDTERQRHLIFYPRIFLKALNAMRVKRRRTAGSLAELSNELHCILFCVCYYLCWDPCRERGGPLRTEGDFFPCRLPQCTHTLPYLAGEHVLERFTLTEAYPATADMLEHTPVFKDWFYPIATEALSPSLLVT